MDPFIIVCFGIMAAYAGALFLIVRRVNRRYEAIKNRDAIRAQSHREWHGVYLSEDALVADVLAKVQADPEAVKHWRDPVSWYMPLLPSGRIDSGASEYAGCLMFAGMSIRNWYGLWHPENPYTSENPEPDDPKHPDHLSGRVINRVREALAQ